jgi:hypothetical protein
MGGVLSGENQTFFDELNAHAFRREARDRGAQVVQVAGEPVHAVCDGEGSRKCSCSSTV